MAQLVASSPYYLVEKSAIMQNIHILRQRAAGRKLYAVLKANGYGLGFREMAVLCSEGGIRNFAVTDREGAEAVMASGVAVDELLLLSSAAPHEIPRFAELGVTFTVASLEDAENLVALGAKVQIKVDVGLGRRGFPAQNTQHILKMYTDYPQLKFMGIYTHFPNGFDRKKRKRVFNDSKTYCKHWRRPESIQEFAIAAHLRLPLAMRLCCWTEFVQAARCWAEFRMQNVLDYGVPASAGCR